MFLFGNGSQRSRKPSSSTASISSNSASTTSLAPLNSPPLVPPPPGHTPLGGRGTLSDGEYARKCRILMKLLRDLRDVGYVSLLMVAQKIL